MKRDNFLVALDDPEEAIKLEIEQSPLQVYPVVYADNKRPITYVKTQPIRNPWELWEIDPRSVKVKIADLGVGQSFPIVMRVIAEDE